MISIFFKRKGQKEEETEFGRPLQKKKKRSRTEEGRNRNGKRKKKVN